jgi:superfamily II DNA or RNA helicase
MEKMPIPARLTAGKKWKPCWPGRTPISNYLEAPTGAGKTNMAVNLTLRVLEADSRINHIFYIFPFNTLVEQTRETLQPFFGNQLAVINSLTPATPS